MICSIWLWWNDNNKKIFFNVIKKSINNNDTKKNIEQEKFVNIPKKKFQSLPSLTLVKMLNRKDIFGEEIKKGGNHRISFVDDKIPLK